MGYHISGIVSAFFFFLSLIGIYDQLKIIQRRAHAGRALPKGETPTSILSLNQFFTSFIAFYAFFIYGFCIPRFNHYLVWPRLMATFLVLWVLFELMRDRQEWKTQVCFVASLGATVTGLFFLVSGPHASVEGQRFSQGLVLIATLLLAQGYLHQAYVIRNTARVGAVSLRMHQLLFLKDASSFALGIFMGLSTGWPLIMLNGVSGLTKVVVMSEYLRCIRSNHNGP